MLEANRSADTARARIAVLVPCYNEERFVDLMQRSPDLGDRLARNPAHQ